MPSPIGHSIISLGVYYLSKSRFEKINREWKRFIFVLILGNLPDLDFIPGALIGDLNRYHETYTHTLGFVFIVNFLIWLALFLFRHKELYKMTFLALILLYAHIISDSFNMDSRPPIGVMMFWPITDRHFYMRTPLIYPFDRQNLQNIFSVNSLFALFTELLVSIPLLALGIISIKKKRWKKRIIFVLLLLLSIFISFRLTIFREDHTPMESDILSKLHGQIVFNSNRSGTNQIYMINANGKELRQLTNGNGENLFSSWSPNGDRIAFVSTRDGNREIYLMDRKGKRHKRLTFDPANDTDPVWMPDGENILFVSDRSGTPNLYYVDANGKNPRMITQFTKGEYGRPAISNKGDKILYISNEAMGWQIYSYDLVSNQIERLTGPPGGNCDPDISNDGNRILYVTRLGMGNSEIWIMDNNGDNKKQLISHPALDYNPKFSPDNKYMVFNSNRSGIWDLYILEMDSGRVAQLMDDKSDNERPDWL